MVVHRLARLTVWCIVPGPPSMLRFVIAVWLELGPSNAARTCIAAAPLVLPGLRRFIIAFLGMCRLRLLRVMMLLNCPSRFLVLTILDMVGYAIFA